MKTSRILAWILAVLLLSSAFSLTSCDKQPSETTTPTGTVTDNTGAETGEDERKSVEDTVPKTLNYATNPDNTVTFFTRNDATHFEFELACEELKNDTLYDAIHYRNIDVEGRLGVKIKTIGQPGQYAVRKEWNEKLSSSVLTNSGDYDGTAFYIRTGAGLAKEGVFYNLMELAEDTDGYLNFSKPWWNQTMLGELTVGNALFFAGGDLTVTETQLLYSIFFNKDLFNEKFPTETSEALYQSVRDGSWTIDKMTEYVSAVWEDTNTDGKIDDGDVVGFASCNSGNDARGDAWLYAMGLNPISIGLDGSAEISMYNSQTVPAWEKVTKLISGTAGSFWDVNYKRDGAETNMVNGNTLFAHEPIIVGEEMREATIQYGVLPMPKYDEEQDGYRTAPSTTASAIALCSNLSDERAVMLSAVLEVLAAETYKQVTPAYYGKVLQGQYSKDQADAEMFDYVLGSSYLCFGYAYSSIVTCTGLFRSCGSNKDVQSEIDGNKAKYTKQAQELVDYLLDIAG